ncbi:amidohydrolase family protein [Paraburkholderia sp.]|uniref:amidohydrolase family protein n=1 Tax=Paraburkholderia sp. TaxID=1926495 RepID=UPI003C79B51E
MRVDVHAHHLPGSYLDKLRQGGFPVFGQPHTEGTLQSMIANQDTAGIDVQILSTGGNRPYLRDRDLAIDAAREVNDIFRRIMTTYGGRFSAFGNVPLPHADAAAAEAARCLDELGFAGIHLGCSVLGQTLDDPAFDAFWQALDRRQAVVYLHPGGIMLGTEPGLAGMDDSLIAVTIGSAAELATAALRLVIVQRRYPHVRIIVGLLGGALPFLLDRVDWLTSRWKGASILRSDVTEETLADALRAMYYDTDLHPDSDTLAFAAKVYGTERLLFGSDSPSGTPADALGFIEAAGLSAWEREGIVGRNAVALFGDRIPAR